MSLLFTDTTDTTDELGLDLELGNLFDNEEAGFDDEEPRDDHLGWGMHLVPDTQLSGDGEDPATDQKVVSTTPVRLDPDAIAAMVELPRWLFDAAGEDRELVTQLVATHRRVVALEIIEVDLHHRTDIPDSQQLQFKLRQLQEVSGKVSNSKLAHNALTCDRNDPEWVGNIVGALTAARAQHEQIVAELTARHAAARNARRAHEALRRAARRNPHNIQMRMGAVKFRAAQLVGTLEEVTDPRQRGQIFAHLAKVAPPLAQDRYVRAALTGTVPAEARDRVVKTLHAQAKRHRNA